MSNHRSKLRPSEPWWTRAKNRFFQRWRSECCGIVGYLGDRESWTYLSSGIQVLQNRGYDSCGVTTLSGGTLVTSKFAASDSETAISRLLDKEVMAQHSKHTTGIGHTRWATHGAKSDRNAHPHHDWKNRIALIHNGTIDNFLKIKNSLMSRSIPFHTDTDTEVIANLIGYFLDKFAAHNSKRAQCEAKKELISFPTKRSLVENKFSLSGTYSPSNCHPETPQSMPTDTNTAASNSKSDRESLSESEQIETKYAMHAKDPADSQTETGKTVVVTDTARAFEMSVAMALGRLAGTWGLAIVHRDHPDRLVIARHGSPLLMGGDHNEEILVASEAIVLRRRTNNIFDLRDGQILVIAHREGIRDISRMAQVLVTQPKGIQSMEDFDSSPTSMPIWAINSSTTNITMDSGTSKRLESEDGTVDPRRLNFFNMGAIEIAQIYAAGVPTDGFESVAEYCSPRSDLIDCVMSSEDMLDYSPIPYPHWTLREICEQGQSLSRAISYGGRVGGFGLRVKLGGLDQRKAELLEHENLTLLGCGTSLYASMFAVLLFRRLGIFSSVNVLDASEVELNSFPLNNTLTIFTSQSGETRDLLKASSLAKSLCLRRLSVVNVVGSQLARETGCGVYMNAGREVGVGATKSFTASLIIMCLIGSWFAQERDQNRAVGKGLRINIEDTEKLVDYMTQVPLVVTNLLRDARFIESCRTAADALRKSRSLIVLGKGFGYPIALEAALKIKELSYVHAEAFPAGSLKHGPLSLIGPDASVPVLAFVFDDDQFAMMVNTVHQLLSRQTFLIIISDIANVVSHLQPASKLATTPANARDNASEVSLLCQGCQQSYGRNSHWNISRVPSSTHCSGVSRERVTPETISLIPPQRPLKAMPNFMYVIEIPSCSILTPLVAAIPAQLIAYYMSVGNGHNPDQPRCLAKTVTVD